MAHFFSASAILLAAKNVEDTPRTGATLLAPYRKAAIRSRSSSPNVFTGTDHATATQADYYQLQVIIFMNHAD